MIDLGGAANFFFNFGKKSISSIVLRIGRPLALPEPEPTRPFGLSLPEPTYRHRPDLYGQQIS